MKRSIYVTVLFLFVVLNINCSGIDRHPINPNKLPDNYAYWRGGDGIHHLEAGDGYITVHMNEATNVLFPPVSYLIFIDEDENPWDQIPVIQSTSDPYTINGLENGREYFLGVKCMDSSRPPYEGVETNVYAARPFNKGWIRTWGSEYNLRLSNIAVDGNNICIVGFFGGIVDLDPGDGVDEHTSHDAGSLYISKYDDSGRFQWAKHFEKCFMQRIADIAIDKFGNIILLGTFHPGTIPLSFGLPEEHESKGEDDIFLAKFDNSGDPGWVKTWGGSGRDLPWSVSTDSNANILISGSFTGRVDFDPGPDEDILDYVEDSYPHQRNWNSFLCKYNMFGEYEWGQSWGDGDSYGTAKSAVAPDGTVYVSGSIDSYEPVDLDPGDGEEFHSPVEEGECLDYISAFNPDGTFRWARSRRGLYGSVAADQLSNVYAVSTREFNKFDVNGKNIFRTMRKDFNISNIFSVNPDGSIIALITCSDNVVTLNKFSLVKYDPSGNLIWERDFSERINTIDTNLDGEIFAAGRFYDECFNFGRKVSTESTAQTAPIVRKTDMYLMKLDSDGYL